MINAAKNKLTYTILPYTLKDKCIVKEQIKSSFICSNYHRVWGNFKLYILHIVIVLQFRHHFWVRGKSVQNHHTI